MTREIISQLEERVKHKPGQETINSIEGLKDLKLVSYSLFIIWPILAIVSLVAGLVKLLSFFNKKNKLKDFSVMQYFSIILLPFYLIRSSAKQKETRTLIAVLLLLPFMLSTLFSPLFLLSSDNNQTSVNRGLAKPPVIFSVFRGGGEGLFGTNGNGEGIAQLIFKGTGQIYSLTFITVLFVIISGLWMGKQTYHRKTEFYIMGFAEIFESVPVFFLLLVILSIFGWWESYIRESGILIRFFFNVTFIATIAILMGLSFLPRLIRIISERIKTFSSENFIDATKALGISQNKILWYHIIRKNCLQEIILFVSQIWASIILLEISMDFLVSIFPVLGAKVYSGWAQMLLSSETVRAILFIKELNFQHWWYYFFPVFFIITTVTGFYIYGDCLRRINEESKIDFDSIEKIPLHSLIHSLIAK